MNNKDYCVYVEDMDCMMSIEDAVEHYGVNHPNKIDIFEKQEFRFTNDNFESMILSVYENGEISEATYEDLLTDVEVFKKALNLLVKDNNYLKLVETSLVYNFISKKIE